MIVAKLFGIGRRRLEMKQHLILKQYARIRHAMIIARIANVCTNVGYLNDSKPGELAEAAH